MASWVHLAAAKQPDLPGFLEELWKQAGLVLFEIRNGRDNFIADEFFRGLADQFLIVGQFGGGENISGRARFD